MKHPDHIVGFDGTIKEAAEAIENMRYDKVVEFLGCLSQRFYDQEKKDFLAGKHFLSDCLHDVAYYLEDAACHLGQAWETCKPHMESEDE